MLKLAANLSFLYSNLPFLDRFEAAARDGFKGVEFLFPYDQKTKEIASRLEDHQLQQALFNLPPGDWQRGDRGLASLPGREDEFLQSVRLALDVAAELGCRRLHVMAGLQDTNLTLPQQTNAFVQSLEKAVALAPPYDITLLIEPINRQDIPNYFLNDFDMARDIISQINSPRLKLQFDIYHCQKIHGNISQRLTELLPITGHIQIANPPDRTEPDVGEINYSYLLNKLSENNYSNWIGCEYKPSAQTSQTLGWAADYLS